MNGYLNETTGVLGGLLPAPHDSVRIQIGYLESNHIYLAYEGTRDALLSCGAIDALMAGTFDREDSGRDVRLRPYTTLPMPNGAFRITRILASIKNAADLPGVRGIAVQLSPLRPRRRHLRPV